MRSPIVQILVHDGSISKPVKWQYQIKSQYRGR
jgi:hypothetical protein